MPSSNDARHRHDERGLTLVEMALAVVVLIGVCELVMRLGFLVRGGQRTTTAVLKTMRNTRKTFDGLRPLLSASVFLAQENTAGTAYAALMDRSRGPTAISARLPAIDATGEIRKDLGGETRTGNSILFAEQVGYNSFVTGGSRLYSVPLYRFHYLYLSEQGDGIDADSPGGLDLNHWVSETVADAAAIDAVTNSTHLTALLNHLRTATVDSKGRPKPRVEVVWTVAQDPATSGTLRSITTSDALSALPPPGRGSTWKIIEDKKATQYTLLAPRGLAVASVHAPARMEVSKFADMDADTVSTDGFPHGFEVQIVGRSSARKILVNLLVIERTDRRTPVFSRRSFVAYTPQGIGS